MKKFALLLAIVSLLSLAACGGSSSDGSKELQDVADALREEAAQDGVDLDEMIANEQAEYEKQHEEYLQNAATREEALELIRPDAEAILAAYEAVSNSTGSDAVKAAGEYNALLTAYVEKWKDTDFKDLARNEATINVKVKSLFPDKIMNIISALYDNVTISDYDKYTFYMNKNDPDKVFAVFFMGDLVDGDYHILKSDGSMYTPDFSTMDDRPDHYIWFIGDTVYFTYAGYGDHPYVNWYFDLNGSTAGVGNTEELEYDNMAEEGYWSDNLDRALIDLSQKYNALYGLDIWNS